MKHCQSCGMPLIPDNSRDGVENYCMYCTNEEKVLKTRQEVQYGIAEWLKMFLPEDQKKVDVVKRADMYLKAMPAWAEV